MIRKEYVSHAHSGNRDSQYSGYIPILIATTQVRETQPLQQEGVKYHLSSPRTCYRH